MCTDQGMTLQLSPTLCPPRQIDVLGQSLNVSIRSHHELELLVEGTLRVGRTTYAATFVERLDVCHPADPQTWAGLVMDVVDGPAPKYPTFVKHHRAVGWDIYEGLCDLGDDSTWWAARLALVYYQRSISAYCHLAKVTEAQLKAPPRQRTTRPSRQIAQAMRELRIAEAGTLFPGRALVLALQLLEDRKRTVEAIAAAVEEVHPELLFRCEHEGTAGLPARGAALLGCADCGTSLGGQAISWLGEAS